MNQQNYNCMPQPTPCRDICPPMPPREMCLSDVPLAMAYVPFQIWNKTYDLDKALQAGTLFPCLDKPFMGRCVCK